VVYVRRGVYTMPFDGLSIRKSGTATRPITIRAYPGENAVLSRPQVWGPPYRDGADGGGRVVGLFGASYIVLDGLTIRGGFISVQVDAASHHNQILNCDIGFSHLGGMLVQSDFAHGACPADKLTHDNLIKGCRFHHNGLANWTRAPGITDSYALQIRHAMRNTVEDSIFYFNPSAAVHFAKNANGNRFRRNVISDASDVGLYLDSSSSAVITSNLFYVTPKQYNGPAEARPIKGGTFGLLINNESICQGIGSHIDGIAGPSVGHRVTNNIFVNHSKAALYVYPYCERLAFSDFLIAHNTFINNGRNLHVRAPLQASTLRDNIIISESGGTAVSVENPDSSLSFSRNVYFGSGIFVWGETKSFAQWRATAHDTSSRLINPRLVNARYIPPRIWSKILGPSGVLYSFRRIGLPPWSSFRSVVTRPYHLQSDSPVPGAGVRRW
jgi:parallel beta-helix repeat protein